MMKSKDTEIQIFNPKDIDEIQKQRILEKSGDIKNQVAKLLDMQESLAANQQEIAVELTTISTAQFMELVKSVAELSEMIAAIMAN